MLSYINFSAKFIKRIFLAKEMESILHTLAQGKNSPEVHEAFIKFSKGRFDNKYLLEVKQQKEQWSIRTGAEYVNFLVQACLAQIRGELAVSGVIVSTFDLRASSGGFVFDPEEEVKQFMGIKQVKVNTKTTPEKILALMNAHPRAFFALSFSTPTSILKIKAKAPKSMKPTTNGEKKVTPTFCSLKTSDQALVRELTFDAPAAKIISIRHTLCITTIALPKGVSDPVQVREQAIRKGTIIRVIKADGKEIRKEYAFEA